MRFYGNVLKKFSNIRIFYHTAMISRKINTIKRVMRDSRSQNPNTDYTSTANHACEGVELQALLAGDGAAVIVVFPRA